jgi:CubicO group peptidase (beta-lactamase class C family)/N-acetylglutamate synthase-like GNAT family acetyltransferase
MTARIRGHVNAGFEPVRDAFAENFSLRHELGGACCVYHRGEKVVDLWGGARNEASGEPWEEDTMVLVYSTTKGLAAMTLALAHSRGWLDYEERVSKYWPEFAQNGKERITVRQLLAHQAGLFAFDEQADRGLVADLDRLAVVLARQRPVWPPGTRQAYHAITLGYYESELLRRIDPKHRSLGQFFQDEIATPLGLDFYLRLPESIPESRLATLSRPGWLEILRGFPIRLSLAVLNPRSNIMRALAGSMLPHGARHRARLQRVRNRGPRTRAACGNAAGARRAAGAACARLLRRVHEGRRRAVFARLHEALPRMAVRQRGLVRHAGHRRLARLRRSAGRRRLRLRHEQGGDVGHRRPARARAAQRRVLGHRQVMRIRQSVESDLAAIGAVINDAAQAYRGVIPPDRWHEPYMPKDELAREIADGVVFWVAEEEGRLLGVMGMQDKGSVALVRHAYVAPVEQRKGVGTKLLRHVESLTDKPILIGTWADASWAIEFYRRNGFSVVPAGDKDRLLRTYWSVPERQIETSVVLADRRWS